MPLFEARSKCEIDVQLEEEGRCQSWAERIDNTMSPSKYGLRKQRMQSFYSKKKTTKVRSALLSHHRG